MLFFGSVGLPATLEAGQQVLGEVTVEAVIRMSPQHAKASLRALQGAIVAWEKQFGEIRIPPEVGNADNATA